jgi:TonB family protein
MTGETTSSPGQSDLLLWIAGALVLGVGLTWLALAKPWGSAPPQTVIGTETPAASATLPRSSTRSTPESSLDNPLRMAQLAFDAGMLIEPEDYSAWTLYSRVLADDPGNEAAAAGLRLVADELLVRARTALEQGRYRDAASLVERVLGTLPDHAGAGSLAATVASAAGVPDPPEQRIAEEQRPSAPPRPDPAPPRPTPTPAETPPQQVAAAARPPAQASDPVLERYEAFEAAMASNRLLAPAGENARDLVAALIEMDPNHALADGARRRLFEELLVRARQAVETLDTQAANTWIDAADGLGVDAAAVGSARQALVNRLVAMESARPLGASELVVVHYVPPQYPTRALDRNIEGWVDLEFVVTRDGSTRDVTVTAASHDAHFRNEARRAVEQWRFEPRTFMGQTIEQRSHTRIRFTLDE